MSLDALNWALDQETDTPAEKMVLVALADNAGSDWLAAKDLGLLAEQARITEPTLRQTLAALEKQGFIERAADGDGDGAGPAVWQLDPRK